MRRRLLDATVRLEKACGLGRFPGEVSDEHSDWVRREAMLRVYCGGQSFEPRRVLLRYVDRIARLLDQLRCAQEWEKNS